MSTIFHFIFLSNPQKAETFAPIFVVVLVSVFPAFLKPIVFEAYNFIVAPA